LFAPAIGLAAATNQLASLRKKLGVVGSIHVDWEFGKSMSALDSGDLAEAIVMIDNGTIRVTRWNFPPGTTTGMHHHDFDYVVVPITGGTFSILDPDGNRSTMIQISGESYTRSEGVTHNVANEQSATVSFVEIELLGS
jgi:quercetin dioxygenase-like cupin family protein